MCSPGGPPVLHGATIVPPGKLTRPWDQGVSIIFGPCKRLRMGRIGYNIATKQINYLNHTRHQFAYTARYTGWCIEDRATSRSPAGCFTRGGAPILCTSIFFLGQDESQLRDNHRNSRWSKVELPCDWIRGNFPFYLEYGYCIS